MTDRIVPVIGSKGFFDLQPPFDADLVSGLEYTCQGVRSIGDMLASNEDPKSQIYDKHHIEEDIFLQDQAANAYIVSLQSSTGHWIYVPERYVLQYPSVNGIPYRSVMIGVALPSLPASQDLSHVLTDVKDLVDSALGVNSVVRTVETSKVVLIPNEVHQVKAEERRQASINHRTLHDQVHQLQTTNAALMNKIQSLEEYIFQNMNPTP